MQSYSFFYLHIYTPYRNLHYLHTLVMKVLNKLRYLAVICVMFLLPSNSFSQWVNLYSENIKTMRTIVNNDWEKLPILHLNSDDYITISFDEMSHTYNRFTYHITHCDANWKPSDLYESDFIEGFNDMPVDDYENSINTTFEYTHYTFNIPNDDTSLKLSGNYLVEIIDEDGECVADAKFSVTEDYANIAASVSSNTDLDINGRHQQLTMSISHSGIRVLDQTKEILPYVIMNRDITNMISGFKPTHRSNNKMEYSHCKELIFNAGNEYRRFEIIDMYDYTQNVDRIDFHTPYYHATLLTDRPHIAYRHDNDHNGRYLVRSHNAGSSDIEADYLFVHFTLISNRLSGGNLYLRGDFSGNNITDNWKMSYNEEMKAYTITVLLKQGSYDYQYIWLPDNGKGSMTERTEGDCYETGNEYTILVYFRENGARYDRLIGFNTFVSR